MPVDTYNHHQRMVRVLEHKETLLPGIEIQSPTTPLDYFSFKYADIPSADYDFSRSKVFRYNNRFVFNDPRSVPEPRFPEQCTLVLDLDETLISAADVNRTEITFYTRPHLKLFFSVLKKLKEQGLFRVILWTAGEGRYATRVLDDIDPENVIDFLVVRNKYKGKINWSSDEDKAKALESPFDDKHITNLNGVKCLDWLRGNNKFLIDNTVLCGFLNPALFLNISDFKIVRDAFEKQSAETAQSDQFLLILSLMLIDISLRVEQENDYESKVGLTDEYVLSSDTTTLESKLRILSRNKLTIHQTHPLTHELFVLRDEFIFGFDSRASSSFMDTLDRVQSDLKPSPLIMPASAVVVDEVQQQSELVERGSDETVEAVEAVQAIEDDEMTIPKQPELSALKLKENEPDLSFVSTTSASIDSCQSSSGCLLRTRSRSFSTVGDELDMKKVDSFYFGLPETPRTPGTPGTLGTPRALGFIGWLRKRTSSVGSASSASSVCDDMDKPELNNSTVSLGCKLLC